MTVLVDMSVKVAVIVLVSLGVAVCLRRRAAAARHWVLAVGIACALAVPGLTLCCAVVVDCHARGRSGCACGGRALVSHDDHHHAECGSAQRRGAWRHRSRCARTGQDNRAAVDRADLARWIGDRSLDSVGRAGATACRRRRRPAASTAGRGVSWPTRWPEPPGCGARSCCCKAITRRCWSRGDGAVRA